MSPPTPSSTAAPQVARVERQFTPASSSGSQLALGLGFAGSAALGAGVFGAWLAHDAVKGSTALLLGGLVALGAGHSLNPRPPPNVQVGDLGVSIGDPREAPRVAWCDIARVHIVDDELRLDVPNGTTLVVPLVAHGQAAARIIAEASRRIGDRVDVSPRAHERLPRLNDQDGQLVPARLQLAGRKCAASDRSITFESDARLCPNCAALYHVSQVPAACLRCEQPIGG